MRVCNGAVDSGGFAGNVKTLADVGVPARGDGSEGKVVARVAQELGFVAEDLAAHVGVHAVGSDDEIEASGRRVFEGDVDGIGSLRERLDGVVEDVADVVFCGVEKDAADLAAEDFEFAAGEFFGEADDGAAVAIDEGEGRHLDAVGLERFEEAHFLEDGHVGGAAEVDGVAARAERGRGFDDGDVVVAGAGEPEGQGWAGDACAGNEDGFGHEWWCRRVSVRGTEGRGGKLPEEIALDFPVTI